MIWEIKRLPEVPGIEWTSLNDTYIHTYKIESKDSVFLSVDILGKVLSDKDYSEEISMPEVDDNKTLYISGKIPTFLLMSLVLSSGAKIDTANSLGKTAFDYAKTNTKYGKQITALLEKAKSTINSVKKSTATTVTSTLVSSTTVEKNLTGLFGAK